MFINTAELLQGALNGNLSIIKKLNIANLLAKYPPKPLPIPPRSEDVFSEFNLEAIDSKTSNTYQMIELHFFRLLTAAFHYYLMSSDTTEKRLLVLQYLLNDVEALNKAVGTKIVTPLTKKLMAKADHDLTNAPISKFIAYACQISQYYRPLLSKAFSKFIAFIFSDEVITKLSQDKSAEGRKRFCDLFILAIVAADTDTLEKMADIQGPTLFDDCFDQLSDIITAYRDKPLPENLQFLFVFFIKNLGNNSQNISPAQFKKLLTADNFSHLGRSFSLPPIVSDATLVMLLALASDKTKENEICEIVKFLFLHGANLSISISFVAGFGTYSFRNQLFTLEEIASDNGMQNLTALIQNCCKLQQLRNYCLADEKYPDLNEAEARAKIAKVAHNDPQLLHDYIDAMQEEKLDTQVKTKLISRFTQLYSACSKTASIVISITGQNSPVFGATIPIVAALNIVDSSSNAHAEPPPKPTLPTPGVP